MKIIIFTLFFSMNLSAAIVVIDPGHGGDERGAISKIDHSIEKNLALKMSYAIKKKLIGSHQVYLTRSFDKKLTLDQRSRLAQKLGADIFISIHANSSGSEKSQGFETFYLSNSDDKAVKKVVRLENSVAKNEKRSLQSDSILELILAELVVGETVPRSKKLAKHIHSGLSKSLTKKFKMRDRGIKPGLFYVLAMSKVPGVLLEMGFISNKKDLELMKTPKFIDSYAEEVANGINSYFKTSTK